MAELTIYDSQGNRYRDSESDPHEVSNRIEKFFFGGVRVYLDCGPQNELVVFFRARETKGGRAEQYYAVYRTDSLKRIFTRFKEALQQRVETEYGMTLQTTSDDVEVFANLDGGGREVPGSYSDQQEINSLLSRGESLQFQTRSADDGIALLYEYIRSGADTFAIAENIEITELSDCDLAIEIGNDTVLKPINETASFFESAQDTESGNTTTQSSRPRATNTSEQSQRSRFRSIVTVGAFAIGGLLLLGALAVLAVNAVVFYDVTDSETFDSVDPIIIVDDNETDTDPNTAAETESGLENGSVTGESTQSLTADGELVDQINVSVDDQNAITVSGELDGYDRAYVAVRSDDEIVADANETVDGQLDLEVGPLTNGDGHLLIAAGEEPESAAEPAFEEEVSITIDGVSDSSA